MRLDHVNLENFACFESASLDLAHRFNLIVGDHAKGKISWLNGIAVGIAASHGNRFAQSHGVCTGCRPGYALQGLRVIPGR